MITTAPNFQKIIALLLVGTVALTNPQKILGQTAFGLSAIPPRLEIEVAPGKAVTKEIKVRNESKTAKFITLSIKDFIVTDDKGTPVEVTEADANNRWAAAAWIQVSQRQFQLKPLETKSLMLTVLAPANALPGGHYAMVLHSPSATDTLTDTGAAIQANVGTLVYVTVPGDIKEDARIDAFTAPQFSEFGPIDFKSTITNLSDVHIKPIGNIKITNWLGGKTADLPLEETNIFPSTSRDFVNSLQKKFLFGRYKAQMLAGYGTLGGALVATVYFWVIPWRLIILILTLIGLFVTLFFLIKKSKKNNDGSKDATIDKLESELEALKNKYKDQK